VHVAGVGRQGPVPSVGGKFGEIPARPPKQNVAAGHVRGFPIAVVSWHA